MMADINAGRDASRTRRRGRLRHVAEARFTSAPRSANLAS